MQQYEGSFGGRGFKFAILAARFNLPITNLLLEGALDALRRHDVEEKDVALFWVPGAFEIPLLAKKIALSKKFDALICLGAVIRGETPHFDFVANGAASGIQEAMLESETPIIFSILTTNSVEQAQERAGLKGGNAGFTGALSALEMVNLIKILPCD